MILLQFFFFLIPDIDECTRSVCSQDCSNEIGSYTCSCYTGFQLDADRVTCNRKLLRFSSACVDFKKLLYHSITLTMAKALVISLHLLE